MKLVKEQKLLLIAQESEDDKQIMETMQKLVGSCTFGKIDAIVSPLFYIEYVIIICHKFYYHIIYNIY